MFYLIDQASVLASEFSVNVLLYGSAIVTHLDQDLGSQHLSMMVTAPGSNLPQKIIGARLVSNCSKTEEWLSVC